MRVLRKLNVEFRVQKQGLSQADMSSLRQYHPAVHQLLLRRGTGRSQANDWQAEPLMADVKRMKQVMKQFDPEPMQEDTAPLVRQSMANVLMDGFKQKVRAVRLQVQGEEEEEDPVVRHEAMVTVMKCKGLRNVRDKDKERDGAIDPYCTCWIPGRPKTEFSEFCTEARRDSLEPEWNHTATLTDYFAGDSLRFTVRSKHFDASRKDDLLGEANLAGCEFWPGGFFDGELLLTHAGAGFDPLLHVRVRVIGVKLSEEAKAKALKGKGS